jgi:nitrate/TMAO reductase-like tetraheme cytochrome c subunit
MRLPTTLLFLLILALGQESGIADCLVCHNLMQGEVSVHQQAFSDPQKKLTQENSCETCHGPSATHAARQHGKPWLKPAIAYTGETDAMEANQPCLDCHADAMLTLEQEAQAFHKTADDNKLYCMRCHGGVAHGLPEWVPALRRTQLEELNLDR